jgi:hypothetical protein
LAESVKPTGKYICNINASRITTKVKNKPNIPSEQPGGTLELVLLREGIVEFLLKSNSQDLLMEFQSGPDAPLKPV